MSYEFLIEMSWKSAAIAGAALLLVMLMRSRSAADRGAVLKLGVALLLALPAIALLGPALQIETPAAAPAIMAAPIEAAAPVAPLPATDLSAIESTDSDWNDPSILFLLLYLGGVAMVGGRLAAGLWTLRGWTRSAREVEAPEWRTALARAGGDALDIRLLVSDDASSPLSWGWRRPAILIDRDTLRQPQEADAILAHEVAHVARRDWPSLLLSRIAVALFWFNPLVWRLDREVAQQAEEAADSEATIRVEPARYAQTLLDWARHEAGPLPANAIAAGEPGLSKRVRAILDGRMARRSGSSWTVAAMLGCAAFAAPVAALEFVEKAPEAPATPPAPLAQFAPLAPGIHAAPFAMAPAAPAPGAAIPAAPAPGVPAQVTGLVAPAAPPPPAVLAGLPRIPAPPVPPAMPVAAMAAATRAQAYAEVAARAAARPHVDGDAIEAQVEAAVAQALKAAEAATAEAGRVSEQAVEAAMASIAHGALGMEAGAKGMEQGAANMRAEAARLRNREYREQQIRKAAARGETVTHEDLLDAAEELDEGSEGMREGAQEMREAAREMREEARTRHGR